MKIIYIESIESAGECQGAFDEDGNLLHLWSSNDATWRDEYFNPLMASLGIEVKSGRFEAELEAEAIEMWG